jgi:hypothetical protein
MQVPESMYPFLDGSYGELVAKITRVLVTLGNLKGAARMVPISSAHTSTMIYHSSGDEGQDFLEELAASGVKFAVPTSVDPVSVDIEKYADIGIPEDYARAQMRSVRAFAELGGLGSYTCVPWNCGNVPRPGDHLAWVDSSAVIFANSVLGARTNRYVDPAALAAAITGFVPECGLHLKENRYPSVLVKSEAKLKSLSDYAVLGAFAARSFGPQVYVFTGLEDTRLPNEAYHHLGPAMSTWGNVALFHVVGHTPEAPTRESVWGKVPPQGETVFTQRDLEELYAEFTPAESGKQFAMLGCPHCTLTEVREIARLLQGKKIKPEHCLWVLTDLNTRNLAQRDGLLDVIEKAGGRMVAEMCWLLSIKTGEIMAAYDSMACDSAKAAYFSRSLKMPTYLKSREDCIRDILE